MQKIICALIVLNIAFTSCGDISIEENPYVDFGTKLFKKQLQVIYEEQIPEVESEIDCSATLPDNYLDLTCEEIILQVTSPTQAYDYSSNLTGTKIDSTHYVNFCDLHTGDLPYGWGTEDFYRAALLSDNGFPPIVLFIYSYENTSVFLDYTISIWFFFKKNGQYYLKRGQYCDEDKKPYNSIREFVDEEAKYKKEKLDKQIFAWDIIYIPANFPNWLGQDYDLSKYEPQFSYTL